VCVMKLHPTALMSTRAQKSMMPGYNFGSNISDDPGQQAGRRAGGRANRAGRQHASAQLDIAGSTSVYSSAAVTSSQHRAWLILAQSSPYWPMSILYGGRRATG
jgi:hypothetical protein